MFTVFWVWGPVGGEISDSDQVSLEKVEALVFLLLTEEHGCVPPERPHISK